MPELDPEVYGTLTIAHRLLPGGRVIVIYPLLFGTAKLTVGVLNREWYEDGW